MRWALAAGGAGALGLGSGALLDGAVELMVRELGGSTHSLRHCLRVREGAREPQPFRDGLLWELRALRGAGCSCTAGGALALAGWHWAVRGRGHRHICDTGRLGAAKGVLADNEVRHCGTTAYSRHGIRGGSAASD